MAGKVLKVNKMRKINNSVIMNKSADNPATTLTRDRYGQGKKTVETRILHFLNDKNNVSLRFKILKDLE